MRGARWLLLAALVASLAAVGKLYFERRTQIAQEAPPAPKPLAKGIDGQATDWTYTQSAGNLPKVTVRAKNYRQVREPSVWELEGVELELYHKDAQKFDLVKSAKAEFDIAARTLFSEGDVEISMALPAEGEPATGRLIKIYTSGVHFASDTGKATTDKPARFEFDRGGGSAVGAEYDPNLRELLLKSQVVLNWNASVPMKVETAEAIYRETEAKVLLLNWSKLTRGTLRMEAGTSIATLVDGAVQNVTAQKAQGIQDDPGRKIEFAADDLTLDFAPGMAVESIHGNQHARLISTAPATRTTVTGDHLDLAFLPQKGESLLKTAVATGGSVAESVPLPRAGVELPETRTLRSQVIRLNMRPNGQEIDGVETDGAGTLDFTPNRPTQPKRHLEGDRIWIAYGPENRIQSFRSVNVTTRTERPSTPASVTRSKEFLAGFDPATSQLARIEQKRDFRYDEGERHATGDNATLDQVKEQLTLDGSARFWDPSGQATADRIVLEQRSGDYIAEGHVATTRQPDRKGASSAMLSNQDVLQARAQTLVARNRNQNLLYRGNAVAWQGPNRVEADELAIDRTQRVMDAHGKVVSQFVDRQAPTPAAKGKQAAPVYTVVRAPQMHYSEETRLADYSGGVVLTRPGLVVNSRDLHAYLNDAAAETSLEKALADGAVKIVSSPQDPRTKRTRTGLAEHVEYLVKEQRVTLEGGDPQLIDSEKGTTKGDRLTWFANNDRLLVNGVEAKPVQTTLRKK